LSSSPESAGGARKLRLTLQSDWAEVRPNVERVRQFLLEAGCAEKDVEDCELALVEACNNAIQHAPADRRHEGALIEVRLSDREAEFRITDHTAGFVWPEKRSLPTPESEGGRGLFLIQSLMDSAQYIQQEKGNVLVLRKHFQ
jgi:anti-sigma regulatory factor (Ser/Thr protein kinase)